jgi:ligand-binding sensor domain-containing protein
MCSVTHIAFGQNRQLGTWRMHLAYDISNKVCDAGDKVYSAAEKGIFSYEKATGIIRTYDKASGLNDIGIKTINYDAATKILAIAYTNSNIDLIYNGTDVYNIPDIKNAVSTGSISVYDISFYSGKAYVSSDVGISVIDLNKKEITNTYIIGSTGGQISVYATSTDGANIYAATAEGVKYAPFLSANLQDFNVWKLFGPAQHLPAKKATMVRCFNSKVYTVIPSSNDNDTLYQYDGTKWAPAFYTAPDFITSLEVVNNCLYFTIWDSLEGFNGWNGKIDVSGNLTVVQTQNHGKPFSWLESNGVSWEADCYNGLYKNTGGSLELIIPDGPFRSDAFGLDVYDGTINVAPGGVDDSWLNVNNVNGLYIYDRTKWHSYDLNNTPALSGWQDVICARTVPATGKTYFGSFWAGVAEYDPNNKTFKRYDQYTGNSTLEGAQGDLSRTRISAMTSDDYGNLWISNAGGLKPLKLLKPDGTWKEFSLPYYNILMQRMIIDQNGQLWAPLKTQSNSNGILVWSYNGTIDDPSDDVARILGTGAGNGGLPDVFVHCIAEDKDGNIWAGTNQGIATFYCPGSVLTSNGCDADQIKVVQDGYVGYLFGTESVRAIAVDAANRKWVGTTNGLWLISADGKTQLLKFNKDNSPMPANQVTDIAIDDKTGEVFIATTNGLISYQGDAMGECTDCNGALVYPNPVKPDYTGPIAIKGLVDGAYVKITDAAGVLVYQGKANGSQMIWDGKGYNGIRVKSGVYIVFSSTDLGKQKKVAKILVAN